MFVWMDGLGGLRSSEEMDALRPLGAAMHPADS